MNKAEGKLGLLTNFFIQHSVKIFVIATVSCLVLIAYLTSYFNPSAIGAWLVVGILTSLLFSGVALVVVLAVAAVEKAWHMRLITYKPQASTLKDRFIRETVRADDFHLTPLLANGKKYFENCEVHGPGSMFFLKSNHIDGCSFHQCDLVIVNETDKLNTASYFSDSIFKECVFINMVIWITKDMANKLIDSHRAVSGDDLSIIGFHPKQQE